jgi:hypothetical protein
MDRERRGGRTGGAAEAPDRGDEREGGALRPELMNRAALQARTRLLDAARTGLDRMTELACNILSNMELNDEEAALEPSLAAKVGQKVCDSLGDKLFEGLHFAFQLGESVKGAGVFGKVKGALEGAAIKKEKIGALEIKKAVTRSLLEGAAEYAQRLEQRIRALPVRQLYEIGRALRGMAPFEDFDGGDSDENGDFREGMENQYLEQTVGLPRTDAARAHQVAVDAYILLRAELRAARPVAEQADELRELEKLPGQAEDRARAAEKDLGPATERRIAREENQRRRVESQTQ